MARSKETEEHSHRGVEPQGHSCTMWLGRVLAGSWRTWQEGGGKGSYSLIIKAVSKQRKWRNNRTF